MTKAPIRFFDCFTDTPGGGNPVAIISDAADLSADAMQTMATKIGAPASCFLSGIDGTHVHARFFSPRSEYTMCGHAVIGLFTMLLQDQSIATHALMHLSTPHGTSPVYVEKGGKAAPRIMLELPIPTFRPVGPTPTEISQLLKIPLEAISGRFPPQVAVADFTHLVVPLGGSSALADIRPSFPKIAQFCRDKSIESIALVSLPKRGATNKYQIREFCPAIGVDESAAGGTTNATVSCYLAKHGALTLQSPNLACTEAHQGASVGRPSVIHSNVYFNDHQIVSVRTGGTAIETTAPSQRDIAP